MDKFELKYCVARIIANCGNYLPIKRSNGHIVLMYHSIPKLWSKSLDNNFAVSLGCFKQQINYLNESQAEIVPYTPQEGINYSRPTISITFDDGYSNNLYNAAPILIEKQIPFTVFIVTDFVKNRKKDYLTPDELIELSRLPNVTIGSHGKTHSQLHTLAPDDLQNELDTSRKYLEDLIQKEVKTFSYPFGSTSDTVREGVNNNGYHTACCSRWGINLTDTDVLLQKRITMFKQDNLSDFKNKISGYWNWMCKFDKF